MFEMSANLGQKNLEPKGATARYLINPTNNQLTVRLAQTSKDLKQIQRLRYKVFYEEMNATPTRSMRFTRRDTDSYDEQCKHLIVLDRPRAAFKGLFKNRTKAIGTYRLLDQDTAAKQGGFYSHSEFDLAPLLARQQSTHRFLEIGRSCVLKPYRSKRTIELLWQGLWHYIRQTNVGAVIGCASFSGTDLQQHREALAYLHHFARTSDNWSASAHPHLFQSMELMNKADINQSRAIKALPPLIKAYLRIGAKIGHGAVIDRQFNTIDVLMILPVKTVSARHAAYFSQDRTPRSFRARSA